MQIIFFGNTKYSVIVAQSLHNEYGLSSVVTIPDRPMGRKKLLTPSPVSQFAIDNKIPVRHPELKFGRTQAPLISGSRQMPKSPPGRDPAAAGQVRHDNDERPDFFVVADYGLILPKEILDLPKKAPLNVHHSLLPKYRGPAPAPTAILNGEKVSGVTIIKMVDVVDAGPILAQKEYTLAPDETTDSLLTKLNTLGGELVVDVIKNYDSLTPIEQDASKASLTNRMSKQDGYIDLENPPAAEKLDRMIRAYHPWPSVWTRLRQGSGGQSKIIKFLPGGKIQAEGGKPMSMKDFMNGYPEMREVLTRLLGE